MSLVERVARIPLTARQLQALRLMRDEGEELVYERGECWVGDEKFSPRTFFALLRTMTIKHEDGEPGGYEIYSLTSEGRVRIARDDGPEEG